MAEIIAFRTPGSLPPHSLPAYLSTKKSNPVKSMPQIGKGQYIERAIVLRKLAAEWGLSVTVHPWGGVA